MLVTTVEVVLYDFEAGPPETQFLNPRPHEETSGKVFPLTAPAPTARHENEDTFKVTPAPASLPETSGESLNESLLAESSYPPTP